MFCTTFLKSGKVEPKNIENPKEGDINFLSLTLIKERKYRVKKGS